jgi:hypothetical protein
LVIKCPWLGAGTVNILKRASIRAKDYI